MGRARRGGRILEAGHCRPRGLPGVMDTVALAAAPGATTSIGLFPHVLLAPVWPPVLLAKETADIDAVSGGRLTLGLGVGIRPDDFVVDGLGSSGRGRRFDRDLAVYRDVWQGKPVGGGQNGRESCR